MLAASDAELAERFAAYDAGRGPAELQAVRAALNRRKYIANLVRDARKALES
jgi:hypothetical protein